MNYTITLSSKGQIVLPAKIRKSLLHNDATRTTLSLHYDDATNIISIQPTSSLASLSADLTKIVQQKKIKPLTDPSSYYAERAS